MCVRLFLPEDAEAFGDPKGPEALQEVHTQGSRPTPSWPARGEAQHQTWRLWPDLASYSHIALGSRRRWVSSLFRWGCKVAKLPGSHKGGDECWPHACLLLLGSQGSSAASYYSWGFLLWLTPDLQGCTQHAAPSVSTEAIALLWLALLPADFPAGPGDVLGH